MFGKHFRESLRRLDVRCAQRARWLGVCKEVDKEQENAEELRRHVQTEVRRIRRERDGFN